MDSNWNKQLMVMPITVLQKVLGKSPWVLDLARYVYMYISRCTCDNIIAHVDELVYHINNNSLWNSEVCNEKCNNNQCRQYKL